MTLKQKIESLEKEVADLKQQLGERPTFEDLIKVFSETFSGNTKE